MRPNPLAVECVAVAEVSSGCRSVAYNGDTFVHGGNTVYDEACPRQGHAATKNTALTRGDLKEARRNGVWRRNADDNNNDNAEQHSDYWPRSTAIVGRLLQRTARSGTCS